MGPPQGAPKRPVLKLRDGGSTRTGRSARAKGLSFAAQTQASRALLHPLGPRSAAFRAPRIEASLGQRSSMHGGSQSTSSQGHVSRAGQRV